MLGSSEKSNAIDSRVVWMVALLTIAGFIFSLYAILVGFNHSIFDYHGFRQAQTAITARSLENGGPFFHYQTPVLGPPWSIPFEFPLYQEIVAWCARHFGSRLDETGRAISILFFYACFFPLASILRRLRFQPVQVAAVLTLVACSPIYIMVSRVFMIESTALFFALAYLDQMFRLAIGNPPWRHRNMILAAIFGTLAGLVKVTTFFPYFVLAISVTAYQLWKLQGAQKLRLSRLLAVSAWCALIPVACTFIWTKFADIEKAKNPLGSYLTSKALTAWNFGTMSQRLDPHNYLRFWENSYFQIGTIFSALLILAAYALLVRRNNLIALLSFALYALTIMTFFNLHYIHTYYSYANAIFLIVALGVLISTILTLPGWKAWVGVVLMAMELFVLVRSYRDVDYPLQASDAPGRANASAVIDQTTGENDVILITGLDWSPELPYQSHRRAIMDAHIEHLSNSADLGPFASEIQNVGPRTISEVVACRKVRNSARLYNILQLVEIAPSSPQQADDCDIYLRRNDQNGATHDQSRQ